MATKKVSISNIQLQPGTTDTYYVTWTINTTNVKEYKVQWYYYVRGTTSSQAYTKTKFWESETTISSTSTKQSTYTPKSQAVRIGVYVKAVSKTYTKNGETTNYFTEKWVSAKEIWLDDEQYIEAPPTPTVGTPRYYSDSDTSIEVYLDYTPENFYYTKITHIEIQAVGNLYNSSAKLKLSVSGSTITNPRVSATFTNLPRGETIRFRARARNERLTYSSAWSDFTSEVFTGPSGIPTNVRASAFDESRVKLEWNYDNNLKKNIDSYDIEYTDNKAYFDTSGEVQTDTSDNPYNTTRYLQIDTTESKIWYFRVRAVFSSSDQKGKWSAIAELQVGAKPNAPTTWSYVQNAKVGDVVTLNWVHNSADGSEQKSAVIQITVGTTAAGTITLNGAVSQYNYDTRGLSDGDIITWKVKTKGTHPDYSDWSAERRFTVHVQPTLGIGIYEGNNWYWDPFNFETDNIYTALGVPETLIDTVTHYPVIVSGLASPSTQTALNFTVSIKANESYITTDNLGNDKYVYEGEIIFQRTITPMDEYPNWLFLPLTPVDLDLESGISYTAEASVAMDSGLSAESRCVFDVQFEEEPFYPDTEISLDNVNLTTSLTPYCENDEGERISGVTLSIYRREYDGTFTFIAGELSGGFNTTVVDPHPALDYARYRIVAQSDSTGHIDYYDAPGYPIGYGAIVIQWDERWTSFDYENNQNTEDELANPEWAGSMIHLPYNIDISADSSPDVELVEYIGRSHPVSYYGTQRGESASWSCDIPKNDKELLYAIRRLGAYAGDVYVREPSGVGYWANVTVSYTETHNNNAIPVKLSIQRVEGGM